MSFLQMIQWKLLPMVTRRKKLFISALILVLFIYWCTNDPKKVKKIKDNFLVLPCDDNQAKDIINQICTLYKANELEGDLCQPLCQDDLVTVHNCLNYRHGKFVLQTDCSNICVPRVTVPAVLKMSRMNVSSVKMYLNNLDDELLHLLNLKHHDISPPSLQDYIITSESLSTASAELLNKEYGFHARDNEDVLSLIWGGEYADKFKGTKTNLLFARSFWSAAKQNELRISRVFEEWHVFPKIFAACGPLYIAEYIPSLKSIDKIFAFLSTEFPSWQQRATLAKEILNFVQKTDSMEQPLQLCDIKSPHFGFTPANAVRFIDADAVITDDALGRSMTMTQCSKHEDCSIYDCEGWCNINTGRCAAVRTNNNLQTVCAKVFRGSIISTYGGLLSSPPQNVADKLTLLVTQCADDITGSLGDISLKHPTQETLVTLQQYLIESLGS